VPRFEPFAGIRYAPSLPLGDVTSPPYDVIDAADRERLAASHPNNAVLVDCPVGDLGTGGGGTSTGTDGYEVAAAAFGRWRAEGVLVDDERPSFTVYRMSADGRSTTGVLGALGLERPGEGDVLPHERTTPKAKSDRLDLLRATRANLSAVWGLSLAAGVSALLDPPGDPQGDFTDGEGVRHECWRLDDPERVAAIAAAVASAPVVIADGHHRYETCLTYRDEVGAAVPGAGATLCYVVELAPDQLAVRPIHRVLSGLPAGTDVVAALATVYELEEAADGEPALVTPSARYGLRPRVDDGTLDTVRLERAFAGLPAHEVAYQHDAEVMVDAVRSGKADAGVLLKAVTVEQIKAVADARRRMPPKTTFFWPKPRTGIVFRSLSNRARVASPVRQGT
jgi:uncharacterized protein (DUF1015 family)